jgi:hypothetical protein
VMGLGLRIIRVIDGITETRMVEVFKTNVQKKAQSKKLLSALSETFPALKINFDLFDCDKVLRVEGDNTEAMRIKIVVNKYGFNCEVLD